MRLVFLTIDGNHATALREAADRIRREHGFVAGGALLRDGGVA
jgi:hypothetical protein